MDVIFQSGDFYNETNSIWSNLISIIASLLGAIISGLIAILIFKKGLKQEKEKKRNEYIIESNDLEEYFFQNVNSINFFINKQIAEISKCSRNAKDWNKQNISLALLPELTARAIWAINQEKIYKIFVSNREGEINEKASDFINARNCLYNLDDFIAKQDILNKKVDEQMQMCKELWSQGLKTLAILSNSFITEYYSGQKEFTNSFLIFYTGLIDNLSILNNRNMELVFNEVVEPLKNYLRNNTKDIDSRIILSLNEPIMNISRAYYENKNLRYERRKELLFYGRRLIKIRELLKESISNTRKRDKNFE